MPDGSSSAAPVIRPGPRLEKNRLTKFGLVDFSFATPQLSFSTRLCRAPYLIGNKLPCSRMWTKLGCAQNRQQHDRLESDPRRFPDSSRAGARASYDLFR